MYVSFGVKKIALDACHHASMAFADGHFTTAVAVLVVCRRADFRTTSHISTICFMLHKGTYLEVLDSLFKTMQGH